MVCPGRDHSGTIWGGGENDNPSVFSPTAKIHLPLHKGGTPSSAANALRPPHPTSLPLIPPDSGEKRPRGEGLRGEIGMAETGISNRPCEKNSLSQMLRICQLPQRGSLFLSHIGADGRKKDRVVMTRSFFNYFTLLACQMRSL